MKNDAGSCPRGDKQKSLLQEERDDKDIKDIGVDGWVAVYFRNTDLSTFTI